MRPLRVIHNPAETHFNAALDLAPLRDRLRAAGYIEASSVWAPNRVGYLANALKGWWWATESAGGTLTTTMAWDPSRPTFPELRALADAAGADDTVRTFARRLAGDRDLGNVELDTSVTNLVADGDLRPETREALAALPPRVRLAVERAHAESLCDVFGI